MTDIKLTMPSETRNPKTINMDKMSIKELLSIMNEIDQGIALAVSKQLNNIETAIELTVSSFNKGGKVYYIGAGTSGRIGLLDASEILPTFGESEKFIGKMAGGMEAFERPVEGAEDSKELAQKDLKELTKNDVVIGLAASGRTPYVIGGIEYAKKIGAKTISITCNKGSKISSLTDCAIEVETGSEFLTGSTRLKAGTAQKMVVNMISTISMIKIGKTYSNLMVDMIASNEKLVARANKIVCEATGCDNKIAQETLQKTEGNMKLAILVILLKVTVEEAKEILTKNNGFVYKSIHNK